MSKDGLIPAFDMDTKKCKTCMLTKITKKQFQNVKRETEVLELIHTGLCDLHATPSMGNKKHFVTFIDDASRFCYVYFLHSKDEALDNFKVFKTEVELQQGSQIKRVRTDRGGPSQGFWGEAMLTACYLLHRVNQMMRWTPLWATTLRGWLIYLQGFKQKSRIDYFDTYAPVVRISAIRLLIAMASIHNLIIHQMDVKIAFLNGDLDEEVYMNQPQGFIMPGNKNKVDLTKDFLSSKFSMKDMGEADVILGIRIKHESNEIEISQSHYIEKVLNKFNYFDFTLVSTPMDTSEKLMPNKGQAVSQLEYSRVIGCLLYDMTCTRADIAFVVGKLSRYTSNPDTLYWQAIQRVLKYLKKTMDYRLTYTGYPLVLEGYTDASWISNTRDNSSTSGWVFLLGGGAISWASKKKTCITGSTMKYEFVALAAAGKEDECAATLAKAYSQMYNEKSRHLGVRHNMIRELIINGVISIEFVRSQQNLVDHLTKGLARDLVIKSAEWMGLKGLKHMYLHIIPRMCLEPAEKGDEVVNFLMVNFFEKVLSRSINKEELMRYFSFGRHLDELHVTWAHLEKKRTRLRTNTKTLEDLCSQRLETASYAILDAVITHQMTSSHISRRRQLAPTRTQI
ncbi:zinc finger, CCHC-type containing protein [Tanacetum coccineum]